MRRTIALLLCGGLSACVTGGYKPVAEKLPDLKISFVDAAWDGKHVPSGQQCSMYGGKGSTPRIKVENVPTGANAIIVEFNDQSYGPLSSDGGHGKIGFKHGGGATATLPAVPGGTRELPAGTFLEADNRAGGSYGVGYLPPCSGGRGNSYFADVKAVYKADKPEDNKLLATGRFQLGNY